jgi:hypothetical protein
LHELARRGASIALIKEICSLLVCASCRNSIKQFQIVVPIEEVQEGVAHWVELAHKFVNAKVAAEQPWFSIEVSEEDLSFHFCMTLCFFMNHHEPDKLQFLINLLVPFLRPRMPWLVPGLQKVDGETLLACHNLKFPSSALDYTFVSWVIESSRASAR